MQLVPPDDVLTEREAEVYRLTIIGLTRKEISLRLFISVRTVDVHRYNARRKLANGLLSEE